MVHGCFFCRALIGSRTTQVLRSSTSSMDPPSPTGEVENIMAADTATAITNTGMTSTETGEKEDTITDSDLQAMKNMIGDIKKDPSLLYRLSSLPAGESNGNNIHAVASNTEKNGENQPTSTMHSNFSSSSHNIFVDDDADDVSSIGMMSSSEYLSSFHSTGGGLSGHVGGQQQRTYQQAVNTTEEQAACAAAAFARATAAAVQRTNRDAEIALRMQSLRAKRGLTQQQQNLGSMSRAPPPPKTEQQQKQQQQQQQQQNQKQLRRPPLKNAKAGAKDSSNEFGDGGSSVHASNFAAGFAAATAAAEDLRVDPPPRSEMGGISGVNSSYSERTYESKQEKKPSAMAATKYRTYNSLDNSGSDVRSSRDKSSKHQPRHQSREETNRAKHSERDHHKSSARLDLYDEQQQSLDKIKAADDKPGGGIAEYSDQSLGLPPTSTATTTQ